MQVLPAIKLTNRQKDVVLLLVAGKTSRQIAKLLGVSQRSIEGMRYNIMLKFGARSMYQVIGDCFRLKLID